MSNQAQDALTPFAQGALAEIPKLLVLLDRNPTSPAYGCFDRNYWLYRLTDFPTGMAQEFVWPLALAWDCDLEGNPYYRNKEIRRWVVAGIRFAMKAAHEDASCDDFFPFERAFGATAFALLAGLEAARLIGLDDPEIWDFFKRRALWLGKHKESGKLSNHEALAALCLWRLFEETGEGQFKMLAERRLARVLSWRHEEGWFWEYEGCDLGYQTLTLSLLARLPHLQEDESFRAALLQSAGMTARFLHPDGSFGGEYSSRNTLNFFPLAFELLGRFDQTLLAVNDRVAQAFKEGLAPCYSDDHMIGHHLWNYLLAWREACPRDGSHKLAQPSRAHYPKAGLLADRKDGLELFLALNKGGVFKLFKDGRLILSDTQISAKLEGGRVAAAHMIDAYDVAVGQDEISVSGRMGYAKQRLMQPLDNLLLRGFMFLLGRFFPDLVRSLLQGMLITGKKAAPLRFRRRFTRDGDGWTVLDEVWAEDWKQVHEIGLGGHQASIFVVQSRTFHPHQLEGGWQDLTEKKERLRPGEPLVLERKFPCAA